MKNQTKIIIIAVVVVIVGILLVNMFSKINMKAQIITPEETISDGEFEVSVNDWYNADYTWIPTLDYTFDKYFAVDITVKNITSKDQKFIPFSHFFIDDGSGTAKHFLIDENEKEFSQEISPEETFDITLVFPVDVSSEYILYYNKTLKEEDKLNTGFELSASNLETQKVETTVEHNNILEDNQETEDTEPENTEKGEQ